MKKNNPFSIFFDDEEEQSFEEMIEEVIENEPEPEKKKASIEETEMDAFTKNEEIPVEEVFEQELEKEIAENPIVQEKITESEVETINETIENAQTEENTSKNNIEEAPVTEEISPENIQEESEPKPEPEQKQKKRGPKKGSKRKVPEPIPQESETEELTEEIVEFEDVKGGKVASIDEVANILNIESDSEFEEFRKDVTEKVNNIYITSEINPTSVGLAVEAIDRLMVDVMEWYWRTKTIYDNLTNEKDGKLAVIRNLNKKGSNPDERTRNGYLALKNYKLKDDTVIDLLDTVYSIRYKYFFVSNVLDRLKMKKELLVTMTAKLKMEQ